MHWLGVQLTGNRWLDFCSRLPSGHQLATRQEVVDAPDLEVSATADEDIKFLLPDALLHE